MNKIIKTSLIFSIAVFGVALTPAFALANNLEVHFEDTPLFNEANFLPGQSVTRSVQIKNKTAETQKAGVEIIDKLTPQCSTNCLSDVLDLTISEQGGGTLLSGFLTVFYGAGEKVLSDLTPGSTKTYLFSITFRPLAGNKYQDSKSNFDVKIGFFGKEAIGQEISPGQISGGGRVPLPGLEIFNEQFSEITENSVTITWQTNSLSTSRVIYSPEGFPHLLQVNNPPNYGYVFSTTEDSNKVTNHSVTIGGLNPGTTYYYRAVSHGSLAISKELSFTTLGVKEEDIVYEPPLVPPALIIPVTPDVPVDESWEEDVDEDDLLEAPELTEIEEEEESMFDFGKLLAGIGNLFSSKNLPWLLVFLLLIIIILLILKKRKKKE